MTRPLRIGAMISGGGRTLINLVDRIEDGSLPAIFAMVISSRADAPGVQRARERGLPIVIAERKQFADEKAMHDSIAASLDRASVDLVCLCGYMRWFRVEPKFMRRVINIHPALLPDFGGKGLYGMRVHETVLAAGLTQSGCTVHFVDDEYDHGPTILQRTCPVLPDDDAHSLAARVFAQECLAYPEAIRLIARGQVIWAGHKPDSLPG